MSSLLVFKRLEIQSVMLEFLLNFAHLTFSLDHLPSPSKYSKIDTPLQVQSFTTPNKNLGGEGPQTDKYLPQSPFTCQFCKITTFGIAFYQF
jgi:hypothetical protein